MVNVIPSEVSGVEESLRPGLSAKARPLDSAQDASLGVTLAAGTATFGVQIMS